MFRRILAILLSVMIVVSISACGGEKAKSTSLEDVKEIRIGVIQPISGRVSAYGTKTRNAIEMAVKEINDKGGIKGKKIKLFVEDDEANNEKTLNVFTKLVSQDKVSAIIGSLTSNCTLAINKQAQSRKVILITPSSTNDTVTDPGKYIFRACFNDSFQGLVLAEFAKSSLKVKTAAILYDNNNDYSVGLKDNFKAKFEELGGKIVSEQTYATGDKDFKAQLTTIKGKNPDVLFLPDYYSTISLITPQVKSVGIDAPMLGADGWDEATGTSSDSVIGSYYSNHFAPEADDREVKDFVKKYTETYNEDPNALAALGYDATYLLAEAIERANSVDPDKISEEMMKTDRKLVTGNFKFNEKRNPVKSAVINVIKKGSDGKLAAEYVTTVNP